MARLFVFLTAALLLSACTDAPSQSPDASAHPRAIVDSARAAAGAAVLDSAVVAFTFRGARFRLRRLGDRFSYARTRTDSLGQRIEDVLTADTLRRRTEGERRDSLSEENYRQAETAVNSVAYFALLPYPLGDPAVTPRYAGADTVRGTPYHRVEVTFAQEGGGRDWEDRFVYWFDQDDFSMDYLAYAFGLGENEEDAGSRFREALNVRRVSGARFADYRNYTAPGGLPPDSLEHYGRLFDADSLRLVSTVALDSVRVDEIATW